ncbi:MAG: cysteine dioxygenase family protein [Planctomycetota bacterium]
MSTTVTDKLSPLLAYLDSLTTERADVQMLAEALGRLDGLTVDDLADYAVFDDHDYRRNLVVEGPMYEVLLLCWKSGQRSPIHDHAHSVCGVKVLQGTGTEVRYRETPCGQVVPYDARELAKGGVCASVDHDIHELSNMEAQGNNLVTMHIYSPPLREMAMYDPAKPGAMTYRPVNFEFHSGSGI